MKSKGFICLAVTTPSLDHETGQCVNHHKLFNDPNSLVIEFLDASKLEIGAYIVEVGLYPAATNAFPVSIKAKRVISANVIKIEEEDLSLKQWKDIKHNVTSQCDSIDYKLGWYYMKFKEIKSASLKSFLNFSGCKYRSNSLEFCYSDLHERKWL